MRRLHIGEQAPEWEGTTTAGQRIGRETLRGQPVVIVLMRGLR
ncbi:peroxiredoxin family protein [Thermomicrobium sp. CFH 73360]|nr:peroxiredoxin family protein [Thermomicrobium sp. CFH 73360]MCM8746801.1 peroxiredoxin family protein [Thermomicrobium sp. CFH 73360]